MAYLKVGNHEVPTYGLCFVVGIFLSLLYIMARCRNRRILDDSVYCGIFCIVFGGIGAKILYLIVVLLSGNGGGSLADLLKGSLQGGFVFYGGLFGCLIGLTFSTRYFHLDIGQYGAILLPCLPLVHSIGRIGCHLAGCCHGKKATRLLLSVTYSNSFVAPNGIPLVPVQLIESAFEFLMFIILATSSKKDYRKQLNLYLFSYAFFRFFIEFFRGDTARGLFLGISTSQIISCSIIAYVLVNSTRPGLHHNKAH